MIASISDFTDWTKRDGKEVLGKKSTIVLSDGRNGYTYSFKVPEGQKIPALQMMQIVEIKNCRVMSEMGQNRVMGDLVS